LNGLRSGEYTGHILHLDTRGLVDHLEEAVHVLDEGVQQLPRVGVLVLHYHFRVEVEVGTKVL